MTDNILIFSTGLWRLRGEIETMTGLTPRRAFSGFAVPAAAAVAGWGHKPTADAARRLARRRLLPYIAFEDGLLRSVEPGMAEPPASMVLDRTGIYYDARQPSDLETVLGTMAPLDETEKTQARDGMALLRANRLSKYNTAPLADAAAGAGRAGSGRQVLVVDQTWQDASVAGGLASDRTFTDMLNAAGRENPDAKITVKLHPETVTGAKRGYLRQAAQAAGLSVIDRQVNPWQLFDRFDIVYTVSSQIGFEALIAGCRVVCFGVPFYSGWGLSDDRGAVPDRRGRTLDLEQLVHAVFFRYMHYFDAWTRRSTDFVTCTDQLSFLRDRYLANDQPMSVYRVARWKRPAIRAMVRGPGGAPKFFHRYEAARRDTKARGGVLAAWGGKANRLRRANLPVSDDLLTIEDGFLRSVGLGVSFAASMSYVFDRTGIYYDPGRPSDLETLLHEGDFPVGLIARAERLRGVIVERGLTKYNIRTQGAMPTIPGNRPVVLVPGQVADDESIRLGAPELFGEHDVGTGGANLALLARVRQRNEGAFIVYKPHPDVTAGLRAGNVSPQDTARFADTVAGDVPITTLIDAADRVETATSLAGFEALLRGKPVAVHGRPFYGGWGLTEDMCRFDRRGRRLSLDELVAGVLIVYPRYADPVSGRVCPVEVVLDRLENGLRAAPTWLEMLRESVGFLVAFSRHHWRRRLSG